MHKRDVPMCDSEGRFHCRWNCGQSYYRKKNEYRHQSHSRGHCRLSPHCAFKFENEDLTDAMLESMAAAAANGSSGNSGKRRKGGNHQSSSVKKGGGGGNSGSKHESGSNNSNTASNSMSKRKASNVTKSTHVSFFSCAKKCFQEFCEEEFLVWE